MGSIINEVKKELLNSFSSLKGIKINYEYQSNINVHLVEVKPISVFNSENYIDLEIDFENRLNELFPREEVVFISSDSLTQIKNPELILDTTLVDLIKLAYKRKTKKFSFINTSIFSNVNDFNSTNYLAA